MPVVLKTLDDQVPFSPLVRDPVGGYLRPVFNSLGDMLVYVIAAEKTVFSRDEESRSILESGADEFRESIERYRRETRIPPDDLERIFFR